MRISIAGILVILLVTSCVSQEERKRQQDEQKRQKEAQTQAFCSQWSQLKPGMPVNEVFKHMRIGFDSGLICRQSMVSVAQINLGHIAVEFEKCRLKRAQTPVKCSTQVIE